MVRTLVSLFAAMIVGTLVLMVLETEPIRPTASPMWVLQPPPAGAAQIVYDTQSPLHVEKWRHLVVHAAPQPSSPLAQACHFLLAADADGEWQITATDHWLAQRAGGHIGDVWRDSSIGVCLIGDFSRRGPEARQLTALVDLVNTLQEVCRITADRVYLYSDLAPHSSSPGAAFPAGQFSARLLRPTR